MCDFVVGAARGRLLSVNSVLQNTEGRKGKEAHSQAGPFLTSFFCALLVSQNAGAHNHNPGRATAKRKNDVAMRMPRRSRRTRRWRRRGLRMRSSASEEEVSTEEEEVWERRGTRL